MTTLSERVRYAGYLTEFIQSQCTVGWNRSVALHELAHAYNLYLVGKEVPLLLTWEMEELLGRTGVHHFVTHPMYMDGKSYNLTRFVIGISLDAFVTEDHFARLTQR
jgi:hypothetical protein